ncbi:hypothetical protein EOL70_01230 [Leucothrix sargassi]|nr:hypothetical protein EOL70_01230 [Leucothrix sargassi]
MLNLIKDAFVELKPTGANGFEGLVSEIIYGITNIPSKLARSGAQFGVDGAAVFPSDAISFEAKLYTTRLDKDQINSKIFVLSNYKKDPDLLWVLGATVPVPSQDDDLLREAAFKDGISVLILDWNDQTIPTLALALAMAKDRVLPWFFEVLKDEIDHNLFSQAIDWIIAQSDYLALSERLRKEFNAVELATLNAERENKKWLTSALSEERKSRSQFGQPIIPLYNPTMTLGRDSLVTKISSGLKQRKTIFLLGGEGQGKSWIATSIMQEYSGLSIFIGAECFDKQLTEESLRELIVNTLAVQCAQKNSEINQKRWHTRLDGWPCAKKPERLLIVLDGLNQRPELRWDKIIFGLQSVIAPFDGHLIVSTRQQLYKNKIRAGLVDDYLEVEIGNWSSEERDELLKRNNIDSVLLDSTTAISLLNPRLLGIAIATLPSDVLELWQGLTTDRLLFEHLRLSQFNNTEPCTASELAKRLSVHASKILELPSNTIQLKSPTFKSDSGVVAEGLFFEALPGPNNNYRLHDEGLTLALGYALIDRVWEQFVSGVELDEVLAKLLDPISSLDRTSDIVLASLTICVYDDERFGEDVFVTLLRGFAQLQNPDTHSYISFKDCCYKRFDEFLSFFENTVIDSISLVNSDWLEEVVRDSKGHDYLWELLSQAIHNWLGFYSKDPEHDLWVPSDREEQRAEAIKSKEIEIEKNIRSLSSFEIELFESMSERNGNLGKLVGFAMELLVGKPLAPFTRSFLKWGVSTGINSSYPRSESSFIHLTNFNKVDWEEMCQQFRDSIIPLKNTATSRGGLWTVVRMLYATGVHEDALQAKAIASELRRNDRTFEGWRLIETYCATDPCDPSCKKPGNIKLTAQNFRKIIVDDLATGRFSFEQDNFRHSALTGLVRFYPSAALSKHKELLASLPKRSGRAYRALSQNSSYLAPLVTNDVASDVIKGLSSGDSVRGIREENQSYLTGMYSLKLVFRHLSAEDQLTALSLPVFNCSYILDVIPHLKPFSGKDHIKEFIAIISSQKAQGIVPALAFLQYTETMLTDNLKEHLLPLLSHSDLSIRVAVFGVIHKRTVMRCIKAHCKSDWSFDVEGINKYESWYGSWVIAEGVKQGLCKVPDVFARCSLEVWIKSLRSLKRNDQKIILDAVNIAFKLLFKSPKSIEPLAFDVTIKPSEYGEPPLCSLETAESNEENNFQSFVSETDEEFIVRHKSLRDMFDSFESKLNKNTAVWILNKLDRFDIQYIAEIAPELVESWMHSLLSRQEENLYLEKNLYCTLALACSENLPEEANELFRKVAFSKSFATIAAGNYLTADHMTIWESGRSQILESLRTERLNSAKNDHILALEVLAAEKSGREDFIRSYVEDGISSGHPYVQSQAVMVAGFSNQTELFEETLKLSVLESGLVGDTAKFALEAHKRCCWSKHWASVMMAAKTKDEFWCATQLLVKIVDSRIFLHLNKQQSLGVIWEDYRQETSKSIGKRVDKWKKKREETYLGIKSVDDIFKTA